MKRFSRLRKISELLNGSTSKNGNPNREKAELEIQKLRVDIENGRRQFKNYLNLEYTKAIMPFLTFIGTIAAILISFSAQRKQLENQQQQLLVVQKQHLDNNILAKASQLANAKTESAKSVSLFQLAFYFDSTYKEYHQQIIDLILSYGESDSSLLVKNQVQQILVQRIPKLALPSLISRNLEMQKGLGRQQFLWNKPQGKGDSFRIENLTWNINAILGCINKLRVIDNYDLSNLILGLSVPVFDSVNGKIGSFKSKTDQRIDSVVFRNVKFDEALLVNIRFSKCIFKGTSFSEANLVNTRFSMSRFYGSSFENINWIDSEYIALDHQGIANPSNNFKPNWNTCLIDSSFFSVGIYKHCDTISDVTKKETFFINSKWHFTNLGGKNKPSWGFEKCYWVPRIGNNIEEGREHLFKKLIPIEHK